MSLLLWMVFGFVIGTVARALQPARPAVGPMWTAVLGVGGAVLGGVLASVIFNIETGQFSAVGAVGAVLGSVVVLAAASVVNRPTRTPS